MPSVGFFKHEAARCSIFRVRFPQFSNADPATLGASHSVRGLSFFQHHRVNPLSRLLVLL